jgi:outer membrane protein OmpA-like peptidoglycan-associated protein
MRFDWIAMAASIALVGLWSTGAAAQSDSASPAGDQTIHLHMPGQAIHLHPIRHPAAESAAPEAADTRGAQPAAAPPARSKAAHGSAAAKTTIPFSLGGDDTAPEQSPGNTAPAPSPALKTASIPPHPAPPTHSSPADTEHVGLTKHGAVMFEKGATSPSPPQLEGVKLLAGDLSTALESGGSRVQLEAYGGTPGDKSSDARRLSLKRALAVRQLLIDNGVPSSRIDVRAMGGADDKGPTDRVDVFVRAG